MSKTVLASKETEQFIPAMAKHCKLSAIYEEAKTRCRHNCLKHRDTNCVIIPQAVWQKNQDDLIKARCQSKPTSDELDGGMKQLITQKLQEIASVLKSSAVKTSLSFTVSMRLCDGNESYTGETKEFSLCESCFVYWNYHKCLRTFLGWKTRIKDSMICLDNVRDTLASVNKSINELQKSSQQYRNVKQARKALDKYGLTPAQVQMACVPNTPAALQAYLWMLEFFSLVGDSAPNRYEKVQIPGIYTKESIHSIYQNHIKILYSANEHAPLEGSAFKELWNNIFPNVTISKWCQVSGKCFTCWQLYLRQELFASSKELESLKEFSQLHKIMIERCRMTYVENRQLAQAHPDLYMSLIVDGMSQGHCKLPWHANKNQQTNHVLAQKIIGAKQHGISRSFYRSYSHIKTGSNLACEVVLREIDARMDYCKENNKPFPKCLLLQVDGGPENTSKTFYALCEHLVREGIFERVDVSRLPVGHTHEDIDAMFGVLWRACQGKTIMTPAKWKKIALGAFTNEVRKKKVIPEDHYSYDGTISSDDEEDEEGDEEEEDVDMEEDD